MATIQVQSAGTLKDLTRLRRALLNPKPYLIMIASELSRVARISFEKEQSPEGSKWAPLSRRYSAWKSKKMPGRGILRASGQLVRTIFTGTTERTAFISTSNLPHAALHQYGFNGMVTIPAHNRAGYSRRKAGGKRRSIKVKGHSVKAFSRHMIMPARPYLGFPLTSERRVVLDIERDLAAKGSGAKS